MVSEISKYIFKQYISSVVNHMICHEVDKVKQGLYDIENTYEKIPGIHCEYSEEHNILKVYKKDKILWNFDVGYRE